MKFPFWSLWTVPYARLELPGWGKLLSAAGIYNTACWEGAPTRVIRGKFHGYAMRLSLQNWSERQTYFLGRYYDLNTQAYLMACVRPGETIVDVGGNIGMITLLASRLVGAQGCVHTFEPNPREGERIQRTLDENAIGNVTLHRMGLSDAPAELTLSVITDHSGMGTFAPVVGEDAELVSVCHTARVVRGDDELPADLRGPVTIKIDVEGFECRALRGLERTLAKYRPGVVTEVNWHHLHRAGASVRELFELMWGYGYRAYEVGLRRRSLRQRMSLRLIAKADESMDNNVAWVYPGSVHEARLGAFVDG